MNLIVSQMKIPFLFLVLLALVLNGCSSSRPKTKPVVKSSAPAAIVTPDFSLATFIYGFNVLIASLTLSLLMFYIARQPQLMVDQLADDSLKRLYRQRWIAIGLGALAVILALVAPFIALALYLVVAVIFLVLPLLGMYRARRNAVRYVEPGK